MCPSTSTLVQAPTLDTMLDQDWWQQLVAVHLDAEGAIAFSKICKRAHAALALRIVGATPLSDVGLLRSGRWSAPSSQYDARPWQQLLLHGDLTAVHTVFLRCQWADQGWGNRKGMLSVVRGGGRAPGDSQPGSEVVAASRVAPHEQERLELRFHPAQHSAVRGVGASAYGIWYRVGGGGGHSLRVADLEVRQLRFASPADASLAQGVMEQRLVAQ